MIFWIVTGSLALGLGLVLALRLLRRPSGEASSAAYDLRVYRDQLQEVERDLARGLINEAEATRLRTELSRRVLAADARAQAQDTPQGQAGATGRIVAALTVLGLVGGSFWLYTELGVPGYGDRSVAARLADSEVARATRLDQKAAEAQFGTPDPDPPTAETGDDAYYLGLIEKLRQAVTEHPDDPRGWALLARNEASLGNTRAARQAQERLLELRGDAVSAEDHAFLADLMITAAGGYVSAGAETALRAALKRDPGQPAALYYLGEYYRQIDRPDATFRIWRDLLEDSPPQAPWVPPIRGQIEQIAYLAGERYELPELEQPSGPTAEDVEAMSDLGAEERAEAIRGMVEGLAARLAGEGGSAADWARLINAYGVLDERDRARAIWAEAQQVFGDRPEALDRIRAAAESAGVAQ